MLSNNFPWVRDNNNYFKNTFCPSTIAEWNELDLSVRNSTALSIFSGRLLQLVKPLENSVYTSHSCIGITYKTKTWIQSQLLPQI